MKPFTHQGTLRNNKTGETYKVYLRETERCWISKAGNRYSKKDGNLPGIKRGVNFCLKTLLVETVEPLK